MAERVVSFASMLCADFGGSWDSQLDGWYGGPRVLGQQQQRRHLQERSWMRPGATSHLLKAARAELPEFWGGLRKAW